MDPHFREDDVERHTHPIWDQIREFLYDLIAALVFRA